MRYVRPGAVRHARPSFRRACLHLVVPLSLNCAESMQRQTLHRSDRWLITVSLISVPSRYALRVSCAPVRLGVPPLQAYRELDAPVQQQCCAHPDIVPLHCHHRTTHSSLYGVRLVPCRFAKVLLSLLDWCVLPICLRCPLGYR